MNIYVHTHVRSMMHTHVRSMCCAPINECFELAPYRALRSVASAVQCSAAVRMLHSGEPGNKHGLAALHCCTPANRETSIALPRCTAAFRRTEKQASPGRAEQPPASRPGNPSRLSAARTIRRTWNSSCYPCRRGGRSRPQPVSSVRLGTLSNRISCSSD